MLPTSCSWSRSKIPLKNFFFGVNESYSLNVGTSSATLKAQTVFGALRGLETFAQVVDWNRTTSEFYISQIPIAVTDSPRFPWRGLLVDSARHFLDVATLRRQIDALAATKMNTLHWHMVDAESFPFGSTTYPQLPAKGAWAPEAVFSHADIQQLVAYGKARGVRVVPEFDIPGHAASWGKGDPSLIANCPHWNANINNIALNPSHQHTFDVVQGVLTEVNSLFIDNTMHLGGDEVVFRCWEDDPQISAWMRQNGWTHGSQVLTYFYQKLGPIVAPFNKTIVLWQDVFDDGVNVDPNYIIEVWRDRDELKQVLQAGYQSILSAGWYLNQQIPNPNTPHGEYYDTWIDFFNNEPFAGMNPTPQMVKLFKGGEACMWGEQADAETIDGQVWPRTAAVGERLWSPQSTTDVAAAKLRMIEHSCRLKQRGIHSTPLAPGWCPPPSSLPMKNEF